MKISIIIIAITVIVLTALTASGFFIYKTLTKPEGEANSSPAAIGEENPSINSSSTDIKEVLKETRLLKDGFEITLPAGWQESTTTYKGILLLAFDGKEDISGGNFRKLDFRTNLSIKKDDMKSYAKVADLGEYVESVKTALIQTIPGIQFVKEEQETINGNKAMLIEAASRQEDADFKTLLVFVEGSDRIVYALSFNAFLGSWTHYRDSFYWVAESFKLKYNIEL